jgi:hypothetical protein
VQLPVPERVLLLAQRLIIYTVTDSFGCSTAATITDTVNTGGRVVAAITGIANECILGATSLLADVTPGGTWSSSNPAIASVGAGTGIVTGRGCWYCYYNLLSIRYGLCRRCGCYNTVNSVPVSTPITGFSKCLHGKYYDIV